MATDGSLIEAEEVIDKEASKSGNSDLGDIAGLLKNVDISQVLNLLSSIDISQLSSLFGFANTKPEGGNVHRKGNREIEVLNAIKPMVNSERGELIDMILQIYSISRILK